MSKIHEIRRQGTPETGIRCLTVEGFKSIGDRQQLMIAPLTVLAGANSAGKSSFLQPLLLLKQTLEATYDPGPLMLDGPCVRLTSFDQLLTHRPAIAGKSAFEIEIDNFQGQTIQLQYGKGDSNRIHIDHMSFRHKTGAVLQTVFESMDEQDLLALLSNSQKDLVDKANIDNQGDFHWRVVRDRCFLSFSLQEPTTKRQIIFLGGVPLSPISALLPDILNIIHLPGLRGNPERSYRTTAIESRFPGTFDPYVASIIDHWQSQHDNKQLQGLGEDLRALGLTWKVSVKRIDDTQVELHVGRLLEPQQGGAKDLVNIADVGLGLSQTLPVVVALRIAEPGRLVYIEQPEIHLHPRAQAVMATLLVNAANRGVRVVIETHSAVLVRSIQTAVARSDIAPQDVGLNWFSRDPVTGLTEVKRADLDNRGTFGDWPEDFDDVILDVEGAYLDAVEAQAVG